MPVLDSLKAALTDHLKTLISGVSLGSSGGNSSSRDSGVGNGQLTVVPEVTRIDDRTIAITALFDTQQISSSQIMELAIHGDTSLDTPAFRSTFLPIKKDSNTEVRIDVLMEVR